MQGRAPACHATRRAPDHPGGSSRGMSGWSSWRWKCLRRWWTKEACALPPNACSAPSSDQEDGGPRDRNRDKGLTHTAVAYRDDSNRLAIAWRKTNLVRLRLGREANSLDRFGREPIRCTEQRADADQLGRMQRQLKWFVESCLGSVATEADECRVERGTKGS